MQKKDTIKQTRSLFETKKKKIFHESDYDSVGLVCDHPSRRNKSKIEFDGYLQSTIESKNIRWDKKIKIGIETENKTQCIDCFEKIFK